MENLRLVLLWTDPVLVVFASLLCGVSLATALSGPIRDDDKMTAAQLAVVRLRRVMLALGPGAIIIFYAWVWRVSGQELGDGRTQFLALWWQEIQNTHLFYPITSVAIPCALMWTVLRYALPVFSAWKRKHRLSQTSETLSDIRDEMDRIKAKNFDPRAYYTHGKIFFGLDGNDQPIYMDDDEFIKLHKKFIGPSQVGKGILLGVLLDQCIRKGWRVLFGDIKPDDFIYSIMVESCEAAGRAPPMVLDLNGYGPGWYGPFIGGTPRERRERLVKAFRISDSGDPSDFYKRNERRVLDILNPFWNGSLQDLDDLLSGSHPACRQPPLKRQMTWIQENCSNIRSNLSEFMQIEVLRASPIDSFDVAATLRSDAVIYVRGNMVDTVVRKATIALLDEIVQTSLKNPPPSHTFAALDEIRFLASDTLADSLATLLSKNVSLALAYQSRNDLLNIPDRSVDKRSVSCGIETNTQLTISYKAQDDETADWIAKQTGVIQKTVAKMEKAETNAAGGEAWTGERSLAATEEQFITHNQLIALPPRVAVILRPNKLASLLYTCFVPIRVMRSLPPRPLPAPAPAPPQLPTKVLALGVAPSTSSPSPSPQYPSQPEPSPFPPAPSPAPITNGSPPVPVLIDASLERAEASYRTRKSHKSTPLSNEELAAIDNVARSMIPSQSSKSKPKLDLSSLDEIEGI